jgi:hypothetical protein
MLGAKCLPNTPIPGIIGAKKMNYRTQKEIGPLWACFFLFWMDLQAGLKFRCEEKNLKDF